MKYKYKLYITIALFPFQVLTAQVTNCTVNAGIGNGVFCAGDVIPLKGNMGGQIAPGTLKWEQVSGPAAVLQYANQLQARAIPSAAGTYVFKISATCAQGMAMQTVTHVVEPEDKPEAGPDQTVACYPSGGIAITGFSIPPPGTLANWEATGGLGYVQGGVFRLFDGVCFSTPQTITLTYIVENANHCKYTDTKKLTINQAQAGVEVRVFGGCGVAYSVTGSCTGAGTGQWTFVGAAGGAAFTAPTAVSSGFTGLVPGQSYRVRYTVTGGCSGGGSAEASFTFPLDNTAPTQAAITNLDQLGAQGGGVYLCGVPDTFLVFGSQPNTAAHEVGRWTLNTQPCDPFAGANQYPPGFQQLNAYSGLVLPQGPGAFELTYRITDTVRGCYTEQKVYFELETPGSPVNYTTTFKSCGGKELSPYNYGCTGIGVTDKVWDPQDQYSTYPISFRELPDPGSNLRYILKPGNYAPLAGPPGTPPQIQGGNCLNYTLHDFEYVLALHESAPSGSYVYQIPMIYGSEISPCGNPMATIVMEVSSPPEPSNAGTDLYICDTQTSLAGNQVATPQWFLIKKEPASAANPVLSDQNARNTDISGLSAGATYYMGYRSYGGIYCNNITDTVIVRTAQTAPTAPSAGAAQTNVCFGMPVVLSATPNPVQTGTSGRWSLTSPVGGSVQILQPDQPITTVTGMAANTTYTFTYLVKNGCDSLASSVTVTTNSTQGPDLATAGPDQCLPVGTTAIQLNGSTPIAGTTGQWIALPGNPSAASFANPGAATTSATVSADGNYRFVWQVSKPGCGSVTDTVLVTLSAPALARIADPYMLVCNVVPPISVNLSAQSPAPGTGTWTLYDGPTTAVIQSPNSPSTTVSNLNQGAYRFYWSVSNGVCTNGRDSIAVYIGVTPPVATLPQSTVTLCGSTGGVLDLQGNAPGQGLLGFWTVEPVSPNQMSAGIDSFLNNSKITDANARVKLRPGKTRLRWNIVPGPPCATAPSVADMIVTYVPDAQIIPNEDTLHFCNTNLISLNAVSPLSSGTGTWTKVSGPAVLGMPNTQQDNAPVIVALTGGLGTYRFRYTVNSGGTCPTTQDEVVVINDSLFTPPNLGRDSAFCVAGTELVLKGSNLPAGGFTAQWRKVSGPGSGSFLPNANAQEVTFGPLQNGIYVFEYQVSNGGCTQVDFVRDTIALATPFAGPDTVVCATSVDLTDATNGRIWKAQANNPTAATINATGQVSGMTTPGVYLFTMSDPNTKCDDVVKVTSYAPAQINQEPVGFTACLGGADTLRVQANNHPPGMMYQWQVSNTGTGPFSNSGAPVSTIQFVPPGTTAGTYYYRAIADNGACRDTSIVATVQFTPAISLNTLADLSLCPGERDTLTAQPTGGNGAYSYRWEFATSASGPWTVVAGAIGSDYIPPSLTQGTTYYRVVASTPGAGCSKTTNASAVTVKPLPNVAVTAGGPLSFCDGNSVQLTAPAGTGVSYQWLLNGSPLSGAVNSNINADTTGGYSVIATLAGCRDTSTITNITAYPLPNTTIGSIGNASLCSGQNASVTLTVPQQAGQTYQWTFNGNAIPGATNAQVTANQVGSYAVQVTQTSTGCSSTATALQVVQSQTPNAAVTYTGDMSICAGQSGLLTSTSTGTGTITYIWLNNGVVIPGQSGNTLSVTQPGQYALIANQSGCYDTTSVVTITAAPPPTVQIVTPGGVPTCAGTPVTLVTQVPFSQYTWSTTSTSDSIVINQAGTFTVTVTDADGCTNTATTSINLLPQPSLSINGNDTICFGTNTLLTASSNAQSLTWYNGVTTPQLTVYANPPFTSTINISATATGTNGCTRTETFKLYVMPTPNLTITGRNTICQGDADTLIATGNATYLWSTGATSNQIIVNPVSSTTYTITGALNTNGFVCTDRDSFRVEVRARPDAQITAPAFVCEPMVQLQGSTQLGSQGFWIANAPVDITNQNTPATVAQDLRTGANQVTWVVRNPPCPESDTATALIYLFDMQPGATDDDTLLVDNGDVLMYLQANDSINHLGTQPGVIYSWKETDSGGDWSLNPDGTLTFKPSPDLKGIAQAIYEVCNRLCPQYCAEAKVRLNFRRPKDDLGSTQVITPNGDTKNEVLFFDYLNQYPENSIVIFNRWGQQVYYASPYKNDWSGSYKGNPLPEGTYYYILNLINEDERVWGDVLILR